jgi:hypothetical protein
VSRCHSHPRPEKKPVREPNRCNLEPLKPETAKITPYLVLARGRLTLQVVYRGLADFRLPARPPKSSSWPTRENLRKETAFSIKDNAARMPLGTSKTANRKLHDPLRRGPAYDPAQAQRAF